MPFDTTQRAWYGDEARAPRTTARDAIIAFLRDKLNDPAGPYYVPLGLGENTVAVVTHSRELAGALYDGAGRNPIVFVMLGPVDEVRMGRTIEGSPVLGTLYLITLMVDLGVNDNVSEEDAPVAENRSDSLLADYVADALRDGREELADDGIQEVVIQPNAEMQMAGNGRNPHTLTLAFPTLRDYQP